MSLNDKLLKAAATSGITPSEHFGVVLYEGDGSSSHSINGGKFGAGAYMSSPSSNAQYIALPNGIINGATGNISVSFWMNTTYSTAQMFILATDITPYYSKIAINTETNGKLRLSYGNASNAENNFYTTSTNLLNGNWHHIVYTLDIANTTAKIYVNGSLETTHTTTITPALVASPALTIGNVYRSDTSAYQTNSYKGKLDQFRFFHNILSASQVSTLYAETVDTVTSLDPLSEDTTDTLQVLGDSSCIATYRFENNEVDLSGNYNGTVSGGVQYAAGRYGQAIEFSSGHVNTGHNFSLANNSFSFSFWFANSATGSTNSYVISTDSTSSTNNQLLIGRRDSNGKLNFAFYANDLNSATSVTTDGTWQHWVCTYNASTNARKIYLNGSLDASDTASADYQGTGNVEFGFGIYQAYGKLDQVRIFNKELSAAEVTTLYNENSLVASYRFEGNANDDMRAYDGTATNVTYEYGLGFTPDFVWLKERSGVDSHRLFDTTRGATKRIYPDTTSAESTASDSLTAFDTGGFTVGSSAAVNQDGQDYVAWCLKANGGTTSSNSSGSITSTVQVNDDAGFSIVEYSISSPDPTDTIGHGLSSAPEFIITKSTSASAGWYTYHVGTGTSNYIELNSTAASASYSNLFNSVTSTNFQYRPSSIAQDYIAYCFHSVAGFSKFGSYTGNGSANGPIVETGFEVGYLMIKRTNSADGWIILDNKRNLTNPRNTSLKADENAAEEVNSSNRTTDFLSNGFQIKHSHQGMNASGGTYIYMAFAADPDTEAPTLASSFNIEEYTGNSSAAVTVSGLGFSPNLVWAKSRTPANEHNLYDTIRGATFKLKSNANSAEESSGALDSFTSDGFTLRSSGYSLNQDNNTYVAWCWKADDNEPTLFRGDATAVYKFEDNYNDVTGTYNGSGTSGTSFISGGKFNKAAAFSGTSSNMDTGITAGNWESWSFWFKPGSSNTGYRVIVCTNSSGDVGQNMEYNGSDSLYISDILGGATNANASVTIDLRDGDWHHIVITKTATKVRVYVDKVEKLSIDNATGSSLQSGNEWSFGKGNYGDANSDFNIDQARYYQGVLEQEDIDKLYNETAADNDDLTLGAPKETIISANANAGFSIVKFEKQFSSSVAEKIPHGLSATPEMIILKRTDGAEDWYVYHTSLGNAARVQLNSSAAQITGTNVWGQTNPTATVFTVKSFNAGNAIAYCFHSVSGYSKFGSYSGNGTTQSITTGFQPDFVMLKRSSGGTGNWNMFDSVSGEPMLRANTSDSEFTGLRLSFESNGFKLEDGDADRNASGSTYIYMAFKIN